MQLITLINDKKNIRNMHHDHANNQNLIKMAEHYLTPWLKILSPLVLPNVLPSKEEYCRIGIDLGLPMSDSPLLSHTHKNLLD